jgi:hypothetical protein
VFLVDAADRLAVVVDRPVLPVPMGRGGKPCRPMVSAISLAPIRCAAYTAIADLFIRPRPVLHCGGAFS